MEMEMEWCKEAEDELQVAGLVHCNMDHATQDTLVGHTRGLLAAAVGVVAVLGTEGHHLELLRSMEEEVAAGAWCHKEKGGGRNPRALLAAQDAGYNKMSEDVEAGPCSQDLLGAEKGIFEFDDEVGRQMGSCKHLLHSCPGNQNLPSVSVHLRSYLGIECFGSLQNRCTAVLCL